MGYDTEVEISIANITGSSVPADVYINVFGSNDYISWK